LPLQGSPSTLKKEDLPAESERGDKVGGGMIKEKLESLGGEKMAVGDDVATDGGMNGSGEKTVSG